MDHTPGSHPPALDWLRRDTEALGFDLASQPKTGAMVRPGGLYVVDDLMPQSSWPVGHADRVDAFLAELDRCDDFVQVGLAWGSGLRVLARRSVGQ
jgi:hypothetical protein